MTEIGAVERPKSSFMDMKYAVANGEIRFVSSIYHFERPPCPAPVLADPNEQPLHLPFPFAICCARRMRKLYSCCASPTPWRNV